MYRATDAKPIPKHGGIVEALGEQLELIDKVQPIAGDEAVAR